MNFFRHRDFFGDFCSKTVFSLRVCIYVLTTLPRLVLGFNGWQMHRLGIQWVDLFWEWRLRQVFYIPFLNLEHKFMQQPPWNSLSDFFLRRSIFDHDLFSFWVRLRISIARSVHIKSLFSFHCDEALFWVQLTYATCNYSIWGLYLVYSIELCILTLRALRILKISDALFVFFWMNMKLCEGMGSIRAWQFVYSSVLRMK